MIDGALLLDKPVGPSSNGVLQEAKRLLGARKAGHGGTLDPLASGLLLLLFGEATKLAGLLLDQDKEYLASVKLGETTATGDAEGEILERREVLVDRPDLDAALERFRGEIEQLPPMHSALKRDGVPLYKLARQGKAVERASRRIHILELEVASFEPPRLDLRVRCSKGTYIRTLAQDIGAALGTGAHLSRLRRTASGRFRVEDALSLEALRELPPAARSDRVLPLTALVQGLPRAALDAGAEARLRNGQALEIRGLAEGVVAVVRADGALIGLGRSEGGVLRPLRLTQAADLAR
ncbi:MAG TPA: tRNA pseudouridine(55) synthase TruB [Burkholderiales bacterium]